MPEPTGFSPATLAMSAVYNPPINAAQLFFNALAGRDARTPAAGLTLVLRELRAAASAGKPITAAALLPEPHRLSDGERETWRIVADALTAAARP